MNKFKRVLMWLFTNAGFFIVAWSGLVEGSVNMQNLLRFLVLLFFVSTLFVFINELARKRARARGSSVPVWMNSTVDLVLAGLLAYYGWFWFAALKIAETSMAACIYTESTDD